MFSKYLKVINKNKEETEGVRKNPICTRNEWSNNKRKTLKKKEI